MRYLAAAVLALALVLPASAQSRSFDLGLNAVWVDPSTNGSFDDLSTPASINFDGDIGYGASANVFFGDRLSVEFAISRVTSDATISRAGVADSTGDLDMMPVTAVLQWHFIPNGVVDPYVGGGAAYVLFDDVKDNGLSGLDHIDLDDDVGFAVNAGVDFRFGGRWGINIDGKYVPLESNATATVLNSTQTSETKIDISPIIVSAGLKLSF